MEEQLATGSVKRVDIEMAAWQRKNSLVDDGTDLHDKMKLQDATKSQRDVLTSSPGVYHRADSAKRQTGCTKKFVSRRNTTYWVWQDSDVPPTSKVPQKVQKPWGGIGRTSSYTPAFMRGSTDSNTDQAAADDDDDDEIGGPESGVYLGNLDGVLKENMVTVPWYIILPDNNYKEHFDVLVLVILMFTAITTPLRICFRGIDDGGEYFVVDVVVDIIFWTDLILGFFCAYTKFMEKEVLVLAHKKIVMHYVRGWFTVDLLACRPLHYINTDDGVNAARLGKLLRLFRFARILRLARLVKLARSFQEKMEAWDLSSGMSRLVTIMFWLSVVTHVVGCFWHWIGSGGASIGSEISANSWIARHGIANEDCSGVDLSENVVGGCVYTLGNNLTVRYVSALYWSFTTLTTVGYGDVSAFTFGEKCYAMSCMIMGVSWYAYIVSSMSIILSSFDKHQSTVRRRLSEINDWMREHKLSVRLKTAVRKSVRLHSLGGAGTRDTYDSDQILGDLPSDLRCQVIIHLHHDLLDCMPFLHDKSSQFKAGVLDKMFPMLYVKYVTDRQTDRQNRRQNRQTEQTHPPTHHSQLLYTDDAENE
jgi:hypothetical protein